MPKPTDQIRITAKGRAMLDAANTREVATILAALRFWQRHLETADPLTIIASDEYRDIATNAATVLPLAPKEIDRLCERLNIRRMQ